MRRAAQVGLALDVDDPGPAHGRPGGDAGRLAEHELAHVVDRQAVDLADDGPLRVDEDGPFLDHLLDLVLDQADPLEPLGDGLLDVLAPDGRPSGLAGPVARFADDVGDDVEAGRQLPLAAGDAGRVLDQGRRCPSLSKRQQAVLVADLLDEPDVVREGLLVLGHLRIELGLDLEDLLEVLVGEVEEVEDGGVADHDHLDVGLDGLRLEAGGREQVHLEVVLDLEDLVAQGPLQRRPDAGLDEGVEGVDHEVPAVGLEEGPGLDHGEIRQAHAGPGDGRLDRSEEVDVIGVGLHDDRERPSGPSCRPGG